MSTSLLGVVPAVLDTHVHQWDPPTTPHEVARLARVYRRAPRLVEWAFEHVTPRRDREFVRTPRHIMRPYLPATYAADASSVPAAVGVGVDGVVHVQADWHGQGLLGPVEETRWVAGLPFGRAGLPALRGIVGHADPRDPQVGAVLDAHLAASPLFRGIRFMTAWHPDRHVRDYIDAPRVLASPALLRGFAAVADRGLTFDAYLYSHQLDDVAVLAAEHPETTIVLDHYAPPVGWGGPMGSQGATPKARADLLARWRDAIARVADHPNVVAKHSGLAFGMLGLPTAQYSRGGLAELVGPLVEHTTSIFGPDRLVFGSNFPMDKALAPLDVVVGALADLLAPQGEALLRRVFRENAERVYRL